MTTFTTLLATLTALFPQISWVNALIIIAVVAIFIGAFLLKNAPRKVGQISEYDRLITKSRKVSW